jgi:methylphosphotriester-DNA--protein-cysteine methyltransferase
MSSYATDAARWSAVTTRDPLADNMFVYCVTTTGIYCRPICPSRLARKANIVFHKTAKLAETAGFRPCKRCSPQLILHSNSQKLIIERACALIQSPDGAKLSVKGLARKVGMSECHFSRAFKKHVGSTAGRYMALIAMERLNTFPVMNSLSEFEQDRSTTEKGQSQSPSMLLTPATDSIMDFVQPNSVKTNLQLEDECLFEEFIDYSD